MEKSLTGIAMIERKLESGVQVFSAKDVAHLINEVRIQMAINRKLTESKK
jgi:hypothetical protein